jgi:twitching motility protein PilT
MGEVSPVTRESNAIDRLLGMTVDMGGSDLHLSSGVPPVVRVDGEMRVVPGAQGVPSRQLQQLLWPVVPERIRQEFVEKRDGDFSYELPGRARFRGNLFVDRRGIGAVFRVIPTQILSAEALGLPPEVLRLGQLQKGLVLVTGPTGSGKSTTMAALLDHINATRNAHIISIEDPIEFVFENKRCFVNQRQVGDHTASFAAALRAALREDPDIVFVGEMRDLETTAIALETAETGHLVFGTLHTTSATATIDRIIDQFPADRQNQIRTMLSESLKCVIAQMLCKRQGGGRVAAYEIMLGMPAIANLIREGKAFQIPSIMQTGKRMGMRLMNESFVELVKAGSISVDEALGKAVDRPGLTAQLKQLGLVSGG